MKIGFKRGSNVWSAINRYLLRTQYSHTAVEIRGRLYESNALKGDKYRAGVRDYELTELEASHYWWIDIGTENDDEALARYETCRGHGYDYFSLISFALPIQVRDSKREYCHELTLFLMTGIEGKGYKTPEIIFTHVVRKMKA